MGVLWIAGTLVATVLYPGFSWTSNTLAEVGAADQPSAQIFDASIALGSLSGLLFLTRVWTDASNWFQRFGIVLLGILIAIIGVAQWDGKNPWLELIALAVILVTLPALARQGSGEVFAHNPRYGVYAIWLGIAHLLSW